MTDRIPGCGFSKSATEGLSCQIYGIQITFRSTTNLQTLIKKQISIAQGFEQRLFFRLVMMKNTKTRSGMKSGADTTEFVYVFQWGDAASTSLSQAKHFIFIIFQPAQPGQILEAMGLNPEA